MKTYQTNEKVNIQALQDELGKPIKLKGNTLLFEIKDEKEIDNILKLINKHKITDKSEFAKLSTNAEKIEFLAKKLKLK